MDNGQWSSPSINQSGLGWLVDERAVPETFDNNGTHFQRTVPVRKLKWTDDGLDERCTMSMALIETWTRTGGGDTRLRTLRRNTTIRETLTVRITRVTDTYPSNDLSSRQIDPQAR